MKRALSLLMAVTIILSTSVVGFCESDANADGTLDDEVIYDKQDQESMLEAVESAINAGSDAVTGAATALQTAIGDTYDGYSANVAAVEGFYAESLEIANRLYTTLRTISIDYYKCLAAQGLDDYDTWDGAMDDYYDIWDGGMDDFYKAWDRAYEDVYDQCDDAIESASDQIGYQEYSDVWSDMYNTYSDAWSDMYDEYSDAWSDIYGDHSDVWSAFYRGKTDVDDILRLNRESNASESTGVGMDIALQSAASASSVEEIEELVPQSIDNALSALNTEFETLTSDIDTYQKYVDDQETVEAFYDKVLAASESLCASMRVYSADLANVILAAEIDKNDMYDELEEIYDCIYDDAGDDIYDGIYDGILDDMYDAFYSGVLEDRDDDIPYADWSDTRSDAYRMWSDTRSDAYRQWSDMRSDVYRFWSDLRTHVFRGDIDKAQEKAQDFYADYAELAPVAGTQTGEAEAVLPTDVLVPAEEPAPTEAPAPTGTPEPVETPEPTPELTPTETPEPTPEPTATPEPVHLEFGAYGEEVLALQQRLIAVEYLNGSADGDFGGMTQSAVQALQDMHGLEITGVVGEAEMEALQEDMKEYAKRAIVVAMTNGQSTDVFAPDGNTYDTSKFHSFAYTSGLHAEMRDPGEWTQTGTDAWHIEDMRLQLVGVEDSYLDLVLDVAFDGENFVLSGVTRTMGKLTYLDAGTDSMLNVEIMEPSENTPFLTVPAAMLSDKLTEEPEAATESMVEDQEVSYANDEARKAWISSQFSIWNGKHKGLEDIIKRNLNDEKSYKHIETNYIDCYDQTMCDMVNELLSSYGYSQRVEVGDLFIMTEFSAKNVFNATIKHAAFGIARYQDNTIELIGME